MSIHRSKSIYDPTRKGKRRPVKQPRAMWTEGEGKHEPLWDEVTHLTILKELDTRYQTSKHFAARFPFSGLLSCSECRRKLHRRSHGTTGYRRWKVLSCEAGPAHVILPYEEGVNLVVQKLVRELENEPIQGQQPAKDHDHTETSRAELEKQRKLIQDGHKAGVYTTVEAAEEIGKIERQLDAIHQQSEERAVAAELREEFTSQFHGNLKELPEWVQNDDPQTVNRLLSALCEDIIIHQNRSVEIIWRE